MTGEMPTSLSLPAGKALQFFDSENYWLLLDFLISLNMFSSNALPINHRFLNILSLRFFIFWMAVQWQRCAVGGARADIIDYNSSLKVALKSASYNKFIFHLEWVWMFFPLMLPRLRVSTLCSTICFLQGLLLY